MLSKALSFKAFIISQILILLVGIFLIGSLYYYLNQYQEPKQSFLAGPVTSVPKTLTLSIDEPTDNSLTFKSPILISGKTLPNLSVLISSANEDQVLTSKSDGTFSTVFNLSEGANRIEIVVFSSTGEERNLIKEVYYSKEKI